MDLVQEMVDVTDVLDDLVRMDEVEALVFEWKRVGQVGHDDLDAALARISSPPTNDLNAKYVLRARRPRELSRPLTIIATEIAEVHIRPVSNKFEDVPPVQSGSGFV